MAAARQHRADFRVEVEAAKDDLRRMSVREMLQLSTDIGMQILHGTISEHAQSVMRTAMREIDRELNHNLREQERELRKLEGQQPRQVQVTRLPGRTLIGSKYRMGTGPDGIRTVVEVIRDDA